MELFRRFTSAPLLNNNLATSTWFLHTDWDAYKKWHDFQIRYWDQILYQNIKKIHLPRLAYDNDCNNDSNILEKLHQATVISEY